MKKIAFYLLGLFCLGFLSCQSLPLLEFSEESNNDFKKVGLVLEVNHSDLADFWEVEIEWLSLDQAKQKANLVEKIRRVVYSIYDNSPRPSNNKDFLVWDRKVSEEIREKTKDLKEEFFKVDGYREIITVNRERYWWLSWGKIIQREFVQAEEIDEGVWRHNFYRYVVVN